MAPLQLSWKPSGCVWFEFYRWVFFCFPRGIHGAPISIGGCLMGFPIMCLFVHIVSVILPPRFGGEFTGASMNKSR